MDSIKNISEIEILLGKKRYVKTRDLLFKTDAQCVEWFNKENSAFENKKPYELFDSPEGFVRYDRMLYYLVSEQPV